MTRLTVTLDEETKALLVELAGGERKVSAFLTRTVRDMESGLLDYVEDKKTAVQNYEESQALLDKIEAQVRYMDERIAIMERKLKQAGVTAQELLSSDKQ